MWSNKFTPDVKSFILIWSGLTQYKYLIIYVLYSHKFPYWPLFSNTRANEIILNKWYTWWQDLLICKKISLIKCIRRPNNYEAQPLISFSKTIFIYFLEPKSDMSLIRQMREHQLCYVIICNWAYVHLHKNYWNRHTDYPKKVIFSVFGFMNKTFTEKNIKLMLNKKNVKLLSNKNKISILNVFSEFPSNVFTINVK